MNELDYYKGYKKYKRKYRQEMAAYAMGGGVIGDKDRDELIAKLEAINEERHGLKIPQYEVIGEYLEKLRANQVERSSSVEGHDVVTSAMVRKLIEVEEKYLKKMKK